MKQEKISGFDPKKEEQFLKRLDESGRRENLAQELKTQLEEDFGMVQFTLEYRFDENGNLYDPKSGERTVELTARGGRDEETASISKIEKGLKENPNSTWIGFSPKNEEYYYPSDCIDFWRVTEDRRVVWNRIVVKNDFESMNRIRSFLSGEPKVENNFEILAAPISSSLKLTELFDLFSLIEVKNSCTLELIERVVKDYTNEFEKDFGKRLTKDSDLIFRLYSACYKALSKGYINEGNEILSRRDLRDYMYGEMQKTLKVESFGCAATTTVGEFGQKTGYFINSNGSVSYGEIPEGFKECKKCGCWYKGEKCPFC